MRREVVFFLGILMAFLGIQGLAMASGMLVKEGARGDDVRRVQVLLISHGYLKGDADGICGKDTVDAISRFQKDAGLAVDGICGQATFELMEKRAKDREAAEAQEVPVGGVVKMGLHGPGVAHVQELLIRMGYLAGEADGVCGSRTAVAIAVFQKGKGLAADGICGAATYAALQDGADGAKETNASQEYIGWQQEHPQEFLPADKGHVVYVSATAYSPQDSGNGAHTAMGTRVRRGIIAVDPTFIPLGTRVYIPGYGEAVAEDTGLSIKGNRIDIAFDTHAEALAFGRQDVELYVIE